MNVQKSRVFSRLCLGAGVLLALPTVNVLAAAQRLAEARATTPANSVTVLHFTDGGDDHPGRMTADAKGNVYIAGELDFLNHSSGFGVLKYNSQNKLQVIRRKNVAGEFQGETQAVQLDAQGNIYASGSTTLGGLVMSFTPSGSKRWEQRFDGEPIAIAIDASGNVYAGGTGGKNASPEWVIVKYSNSGKVLWEKQHAGTGSGDSSLTDLQLDFAGNPIAFGWTNHELATLTRTITTLKLDPHGNILWTQDFVAVSKFDQLPKGLALDPTGSVYITGGTNPPEGVTTPFTLKYDSTGALKFKLTGNGAGGSSVAIDPAGDVLLTGDILNFGRPTFITASKVHPDGTKVWTTPIQGTGKILADGSGNVFVAGLLQSAYFLTKLSPQGTLQFGTFFTQGSEFRDAAFDSSGNLFLTGDVQNALFQHDIITLKLPKGFTPAQ